MHHKASLGCAVARSMYGYNIRRALGTDDITDDITNDKYSLLVILNRVVLFTWK